MLRRLKRYKHANMTCAVAKHKTDSRFAERDALPDYISTHDEVVKHTRVTARHCTRVHVLPTVLVSSTALHCARSRDAYCPCLFDCVALRALT